MSVVLFSLFAGVNIAFAILSFFIYSKNRSYNMYLFFGIFSLFSGLYFFFQSISTIFEADLSIGIIFCAAVYYAIFPWFIFEFVKKKFNKALVFISLLFFLAFLVFIIVLFFLVGGRSSEARRTVERPAPSGGCEIANKDR